jgi:23S rRNA pseudouridine1911/1915/1917 synthase
MKIMKTVSRQMLHAWRMTFTHPESGETLCLEAPIPADMTAVLIEIRETNLH